MLEPPLRRRERRDRGIAFRLQKDLEIILAGLGIGERQAADRLAVAANHRPVTDHLVHRFGERAGGSEALQDVDALAGSQSLENAALDFGEVDYGLACGILQPDDIAEALDIPGDDILGERQRRRAARLELELEALRSRVALERDDAGLAAIGGRQLPLADHVL